MSRDCGIRMVGIGIHKVVLLLLILKCLVKNLEM
ncbi:hypothetical protein RDI58_004463 [Solanum bulbocastanum]|uniref:Uncharacterized protein n=1 Tax=Solanum bulbocastanum TaxID=147425 RepID=A0AAN8U6K4_SOLBU